MSLIVKTYRISVIFNQKKFRKVTLSDFQLLVPVAVTFGIEFLFNLFWLLFDPLQPTIYHSSNNSVVEYTECGSTYIDQFQYASMLIKACGLLYGVLL